MAPPMSSAPPMAIQQQMKEDWDNREFIYLVSCVFVILISFNSIYLVKLSDNVRQIADFLAQFELNCKSKLAKLNDSITSLERKVEFLEARVTKGETLN
jgi:uncharacterized protein